MKIPWNGIAAGRPYVDLSPAAFAIRIVDEVGDDRKGGFYVVPLREHLRHRGTDKLAPGIDGFEFFDGRLVDQGDPAGGITVETPSWLFFRTVRAIRRCRRPGLPTKHGRRAVSQE